MRAAWQWLIVETLLPLATLWAAWQERRILRCGRALQSDERQVAAALGVAEPDRVRVMIVPRVPLPAPRWLIRRLSHMTDLTSQPCGMALGHGIFLDDAHACRLDVLAHELVHTTQFERHESLHGFLRQYLTECVRDGYSCAAMELEAVERSASALLALGRRLS